MQKDFVTLDREALKITVVLDHAENLVVTKNDVEISYYSGGPGGQNVNRSMNGVRIIYEIPESHRRGGAKTKELITRSMNQRSQEQNLRRAFEQLFYKLHRYFYVKPTRKKTRVPGSSKEKRLKNKKMQSLKKEARKSPSADL